MSDLRLFIVMLCVFAVCLPGCDDTADKCLDSVALSFESKGEVVTQFRGSALLPGGELIPFTCGFGDGLGIEGIYSCSRKGELSFYRTPTSMSLTIEDDGSGSFDDEFPITYGTIDGGGGSCQYGEKTIVLE